MYFARPGVVSRRLSPLRSRDIDVETLALWMAGLDPPHPSRTVYADVQRLLPGQELTRDGVVAAQPPTLEHTGWRSEPPEVLARELRDVLFAALERATRGRRKVAVLLGGLDSSAVLASLVQIRPATSLHAITIDMAGEHPDRPYAETLCRQLGVGWTFVERSTWQRLRRFMLLDASPYAMLYGGGELGAFLAAAEVGADLVVTGILGDLVFGGTMAHLGTRLFWERPFVALRLAATAEMPDDHSLLDRLRRFVVGPALRERWPVALRRARTRWGWRNAMPYGTARFHALLGAGMQVAWQRYHAPRTPAEAFTEWATSAELGAIVEVCDVLAGEAGVAWREVLADAELLALLSAIPVETLLDGGRHRGLLRRAMRGILPEPALSRRHKADALASIDILPHEEDRQYLRELARAPTLTRWGLLRAGALERAFERAEDHFWVWRFLVAEAFLTEYA